MRALRALVVALTLFIAPGGAAWGAVGDGPLFGDASDDRSDPTAVDPGEHDGALAPPGDADWYRLDTDNGGPTCVELALEGDATARFNMTMPNGPDYLVEGNLTPDEDRKMGLAVPTFQHTTFGLYPLGPVGSVGTYTFEIQTEGLGPTTQDHQDGHPEDPGQPPSDPGNASAPGNATETPGPCIQNTLNASQGQAIDFNVTEGDRITLSIAQPADGRVQASLEDPSNRTRGMVGPTEDADGLVITETVDEPGTWTLEASNPQGTGATTYLIGLSVLDDCTVSCALDQDDDCEDDDEEECDDEENRPCQPHCMVD